MGKPSRVSLIPSTSGVDSNTSKTSKLNATMRPQKLKQKIKKKRSKTNASVQKLFEQLRNESQASTSLNNNTVIVLDDTLTPQKRKLTAIAEDCKSKRARYFAKDIPEDITSVVPNDGQEVCTETPKKSPSVHCSTPIIKTNINPDFIPIKTKNSKGNIINNATKNENPEVSNQLSNATENLNAEITDLTKEYNKDSFLTIDLTNSSLNCSSLSKIQNTIIDLDKLENPEDNTDCSVVSVSNTNLSLSGESDVTVLNISKDKKEKQMRRFAKGISKLDAVEKGRLLELITQNIFSGCNVLDKKKKTTGLESNAETSKWETVEDTYIKEHILRQAASRNSIGSNIYNPQKDAKNKTGLRMVVIDGSNVAMQHGRHKFFSVKGLKICIDYFLQRGHAVKAFVPRFRCKFGKSSDPRLLDDLERRGLVVYTPSREVQGRMIASYDDRYIVQCAAEFDGVIVSGDNYRDLLRENPRWRVVIETRVLPFTWVEDMIMFPRDPLGRNGPTLEQFLTHPQSQKPVVIS